MTGIGFALFMLMTLLAWADGQIGFGMPEWLCAVFVLIWLTGAGLLIAGVSLSLWRDFP